MFTPLTANLAVPFAVGWKPFQTQRRSKSHCDCHILSFATYLLASEEVRSAVTGLGLSCRHVSLPNPLPSEVPDQATLLVSGSVGSTESNSPTSSAGSGCAAGTQLHRGPNCSETDSGHNSVVSSNYDSHSTGSHNSGNPSPPATNRYPPQYPGLPMGHPHHGVNAFLPQQHPMGKWKYVVQL